MRRSESDYEQYMKKERRKGLVICWAELGMTAIFVTMLILVMFALMKFVFNL